VVTCEQLCVLRMIMCVLRMIMCVCEQGQTFSLSCTAQSSGGKLWGCLGIYWRLILLYPAWCDVGPVLYVLVCEHVGLIAIAGVVHNSPGGAPVCISYTHYASSTCTFQLQGCEGVASVHVG
jgi:hypothetical protein